MNILSSQRQSVRVLKLGPTVQSERINLAVDLLSVCRPENYRSVNSRLRQQGLFLKMEGVGSMSNIGRTIDEQVNWYLRAGSVIPENIPEFQLSAEIGNKRCYVMENVRGQDLGEVLKDRKHLTKAIVEDVVGALWAIINRMHDAGLTHGGHQAEKFHEDHNNSKWPGKDRCIGSFTS